MKLYESITKNLKESEDYDFDEIENMMSSAEEYEDLYRAASYIKDDSLRIDVEQCIEQCENDGDDVDVAYSVTTSDYIDPYRNEENTPTMLADLRARRAKKESEEVKEGNLEPEYSTRKSFYGKAYVDDKDNTLVSYGTPIMRIADGKIEMLCRPEHLTQTTLRHIREFMQQNGMDPIPRRKLVELIEQPINEAEEKTKTNKIPRNWKKINYKVKTKTNSGEIGDEFEVYKDDLGRSVDKNLKTGKVYYANWGLIRNPELSEITNIELDEAEEAKWEVKVKGDDGYISEFFNSKEKAIKSAKKDIPSYYEVEILSPEKSTLIKIKQTDGGYSYTGNKDALNAVLDESEEAEDSPVSVVSVPDEESYVSTEGKEPIGTYAFSNTGGLLVYEIDDGQDEILVGLSTQPDKALWLPIEWCDDPEDPESVNACFKWGDSLINLNEVMRTNLHESCGKKKKKEITKEAEDVFFKEKVLAAYDNCDRSLRADMPTIKDILVYLDMQDTSANRKLISDIIYKAGKDWQIEESEKTKGKKELKESSNIIWTSETTIDDLDPEEIKEQYDIYVEHLDSDKEPMDYEDWEADWVYNSDMWDIKKEDLEENIYPMIDKQINNDILIISGNYNSNYPEFRKSGPGGKFLNKAEDILDWLSNEDRIDFLNNDGIIGVRAADHDGSIGGNLYTIPADDNILLEIAKASDMYEVDAEDDEILNEFKSDLVNGYVDMSTFRGFEDKFIPIKVEW